MKETGAWESSVRRVLGAQETEIIAVTWTEGTFTIGIKSTMGVVFLIRLMMLRQATAPSMFSRSEAFSTTCRRPVDKMLLKDAAQRVSEQQLGRPNGMSVVRSGGRQRWWSPLCHSMSY